MSLQLRVISRFFIYIFFFGSLIGSYGCHEQVLLEEIELVLIKDDASDKNALLKNSSQLSSQDVLERRMQWASYISARILSSDDDARTEVVELLNSQSTEVVGLDQLLLERTITPRFRELFLENTSYFIYFIDGDEQFFPEPSHNQAIPPTSGQNRLTRTRSYLEFLTLEHCIELLFVNGLTENEGNHYYSTAHPLTSANSNYGYEVSYSNTGLIGIGLGGVPNEQIEVEDAVVSSDLVLSGNKIVVCRPRRIIETPGCGYPELHTIDFRSFLN